MAQRLKGLEGCTEILFKEEADFGRAAEFLGASRAVRVLDVLL